jgi:hypothetical protein
MANSPFRSATGVQMATGAPSWQGPTGVGGIYYKTGIGPVARRTDNTEIVLNSPWTLYTNTTPISSVTSGETDAQVYTLPANTVTADAQRLEIVLAATHAANTNTATYRLYIAGTVVVAQARAVSAEPETCIVTAVRTPGNILRWRFQTNNNATAAVGTGTVTVDFTIANIIKTTVEGPTLAGDMTCNFLRVEFWP